MNEFKLKYFLGLIMLMISLQAGASVTVRVDNSSVAVGESFTLTYEIKGSVNAFPDFSKIQKDFQIIGRERKRILNSINGQVELVSSWSLELQAKKAGKYIIPSIQFGSSKSPRVTIDVRSTAAISRGVKASYFVEMEVTTKEPFVQQQIGLQLKIYYPAKFYIRSRDINVSAIRFETGGDAVIKDLGRAIPGKKTINQIKYSVITQNYTLIPQTSGVLKIKPVTVVMLVPGKYVQGSYGFSRYRRYQRKRLISSSIVVKVKPKPKSYTGKYWLPTKKLELKEIWPNNISQVKAGEPITRQIKIIAEGLTAEQLPPIELGKTKKLKIYTDKAELNTNNQAGKITGSRNQKIAIIGVTPGKYVLPEIKLDWWNISTGKMETARIASRTLTVLSADSNTGGLVGNNTDSKPSIQSDQTPAFPTILFGTGIWFWSTLGFAFAWAVTLLLWWHLSARGSRQASVHGEIDEFSRLPSASEELAEIRMSCNENDANRCAKALLAWVKCRWKNKAPTNLTDIASLLNSELFRSCIVELNQFLYSSKSAQENNAWNGTEFWRLFDQARRQMQLSKTEKVSALTPLYP